MSPGANGSGGRCRVFIGDLQGCADELEDLLDDFSYDPSRHQLWFVGDLVNRGPASARALRRVIELGAGCVLGNHDLHLLEVAAGHRSLRRRDTLQDVLDAPDRESMLAWLRARRLVESWDDLILVHAGLHPAWREPRSVAAPLEAAIARGEVPWGDPDLDFFVAARHCDANGDRPDDDIEPGEPYAAWDRWYRGDRRVVCGHWAARGLVVNGRIRSIDTGCVWGGSLSAWIESDDRVASVPARRTYQRIQ
jgi:bis(5'-nucleosyl)-tetraphosphatase (symmetrical)